jgi:hypothetical protein
MHRDDRDDRTRIASHVGPHAFAPEASAALESLGYEIVPADATRQPRGASNEPRLRLVDERQYDAVPDADADPRTPIILFTGSRPRTIRDSRIIGQVERPAELAQLYPIIQQSLERTPRRNPRAETLIPARCTRADHRWIGNVVSLSQGGCRFLSDAAVESGEQMNLEFDLPSSVTVCTRALVIHRRAGDVSVVFVDPSRQVRESISDFVTHRLAAP